MADDIVARLRVLYCAADDLTPCGTCLTCQAADEIERLRVKQHQSGTVSVAENDIISQLVPFVHDEQRMPAGLIRDIIDEIELLREQVTNRDKTIAMQRAEIKKLIGVQHD